MKGISGAAGSYAHKAPGAAFEPAMHQAVNRVWYMHTGLGQYALAQRNASVDLPARAKMYYCGAIMQSAEIRYCMPKAALL